MKTLKKQDQIAIALQKIVGLLQSGDVPRAIAITTYPQSDTPSRKWSLCNHLLMWCAGTTDARGYNQWKNVNRNVKKGEKAFYILGPRISKKKESDDAEETFVVTGFFSIPVFAVEQTDGQPLEVVELPPLPNFPLLDKAKEWKIDVQTMPFSGNERGYYMHSCGEERIRLATPHEKTFFHELSHAAHDRVSGKRLKEGQDPRQEIVAELSAQTLALLVGTEIKSTLGNSHQYIKSYADEMGKDVGRACLSVITDVEKILRLILPVQ